MKYIELKAVQPSQKLEDALELLLQSYFKEFIYQPLMDELHFDRRKFKLQNATDRDALVDAIMKGTIFYYRGVFKGKFNSQITKEMKRLGGEWLPSKQGFRVPSEKIPYPIQTAIQNSTTSFMRLVERLDKKMQDILPAKFADQIPFAKIFEKMVVKVDQDVQETLRTLKPGQATTPEMQVKIDQVKKDITIEKTFDEFQKQVIADKYSENLKLTIKGWTQEKIQQLRVDVNERVLRGERFESLAESIEQSYGVSQSKAKFLARQETKLLTMAIKEAEYKSVGIKTYRWACVVGSPNHPVRHTHKVLNNKIFSFDDPPIVNEKGDRKNPGEDYNCRCTAIPIVRFDDESET